MKWWGWGKEEFKFDISLRPGLWPYVTHHMKLPADLPYYAPVAFEDIILPQAKINFEFMEDLKKILSQEHYSTSKLERLTHAYGKSFRDLWRVRRGIVNTAPDLIIYPENEAQIISLVDLAKKHKIVLIPFGGGSNIVGCLEVTEHDRMNVSVDLTRLNKILSIDKHSHIATVQAGALGPILEENLNCEGFTLGHFPDSFEHSTIGGWVATRSAGMQSDIYGKIEDMVIALQMITPNGIIKTLTVPRSSSSIDPNKICIGSEGILGIITQIVIKVRPIPKYSEFCGFLFPSFEAGVNAIHECVRENCLPVVSRLNDANKTALSIACKKTSSTYKSLLSLIVKKYLSIFKNFDLNNSCLMINKFEANTKQEMLSHKKKVAKIYKKYGAFYLGKSPGQSFAEGKYDFPYLRDYVMDYNLIADVSETATTWSNLLNLYNNTCKNIVTAINSTGKEAWVGCHISHSYENGASLYFTFACLQDDNLGIAQYDKIKRAAEDSFLADGATLSHHHAVGYEHKPWLEQDLSSGGIAAIKYLKQGFDPLNIMNPGKIID